MISIFGVVSLVLLLITLVLLRLRGKEKRVVIKFLFIALVLIPFCVSVIAPVLYDKFKWTCCQVCIPISAFWFSIPAFVCGKLGLKAFGGDTVWSPLGLKGWVFSLIIWVLIVFLTWELINMTNPKTENKNPNT